jgi:hypothetical protein
VLYRSGLNFYYLDVIEKVQNGKEFHAVLKWNANDIPVIEIQTAPIEHSTLGFALIIHGVGQDEPVESVWLLNNIPAHQFYIQFGILYGMFYERKWGRS